MTANNYWKQQGNGRGEQIILINSMKELNLLSLKDSSKSGIADQ